MHRQIHKLSELLAASGFTPQARGGLRGYCMVCGVETGEGLEPGRVFRDTFTEYNKLVKGGSVVCPYCATLLNTPDYRRRSWLATVDGVRFLSRQEVYQVLLEPPEPPFLLYATRTGKKHGWIPLAGSVATSRTMFPFSFDGQVVWARADQVREYHELIEELLAAGVTKTEMLGGCRPRSWGAARDGCTAVEHVRGDTLWQVMVWAR